MMIGLLALALVQTASPQEPSTPPSDDIVVEGLRDIDDPGSAVTHGTLGSGRSGNGARTSQRLFDAAQVYADCAITDSGTVRGLLRDALDGTINSARQRFAEGRLAQVRGGCMYPGSTGYDPSYYVRGVLFIEALKRFSPKLKLTKEQTADPAVQQRFNAREIPLARFRLPVDRRYFEAAVCFVRLQPELSVSLLRSKDMSAITRTEAAIVNRALVCVGNAERVYFDPSQFKLYIADAVYRWAVAARGVDSLVPSD